MQGRSFKVGAVVALVATFGLLSGDVVLAGSGHGVRVHRLMEPSHQRPVSKVKAERKASESVKSHKHTVERVIVYVSDEGPYSKRYTPNRRPWSERRSVFLNNSYREFQNPPGIYSSQIGRAFD